MTETNAADQIDWTDVWRDVAVLVPALVHPSRCRGDRYSDARQNLVHSLGRSRTEFVPLELAVGRHFQAERILFRSGKIVVNTDKAMQWLQSTIDTLDQAPAKFQQQLKEEADKVLLLFGMTSAQRKSAIAT